MKKNKLQYKHTILYEKDTGQGIGTELKDGTIVCIDKKSKGLRIAFPKKKFKRFFEKQMKQRRKYLEVIFSDIELKAILKALSFRKK